jgi:carbon storage regulator
MLKGRGSIDFKEDHHVASLLERRVRPNGEGHIIMLVLSRKVGERILIGDQITVTIVRVAQGGVRIGIEAPTELSVVREELQNRADQATKIGSVVSAAKPR